MAGMTTPAPRAPELEILAMDAGVWDADIEVTPAPGAPPVASKGTTTNRMGCGGTWLITDYEADSGFAGHGVYGWDPARGKYVGTWVDTMRTFLVIGEGTWDAAARAMTFRWEARVGGRDLKWREVTEKPDDTTRIFRSIMPSGDGGEFEMLKVTYRRKA
jgi:hypothetical protein